MPEGIREEKDQVGELVYEECVPPEDKKKIDLEYLRENNEIKV